MTQISQTLIALSAGAVILGTTLPASAAAAQPFLKTLTRVDAVASTVPVNGDINPYGVAVVPHRTGHLHRGWVLVSNFNAASNRQGTGTTIMQISPAGKVSLFARVDPGICLVAAPVVSV
jgi:hypothetical protein